MRLDAVPDFSAYARCLERDDWAGVGSLMLASARKLADAGADLLICPDNTIHQALHHVLPASPRPWLHIADVQSVIERLRETGCDAVVLGCTELPLILGDANSTLPTLDSTRLLARAALRHVAGG